MILSWDHRKKGALKRAFTLTEVFVVIGVLGILGGLILTSVMQAKEKSKQLQCLQNLHQHGFGLNAFLADHAEYPLVLNFPHFEEQRNYPDHRRTWMHSILDTDKINEHAHFGDRRERSLVLDCPANRPPYQRRRKGWNDYGYNANGLVGKNDLSPLGLGGHGTEGLYAPPVKESEVLNPQGMAAIGDAFVGWDETISDGFILIGRQFNAINEVDGTQRAYERHNGKSNILFCDGHAETLTLDFLYMSGSNDSLRIWNRDHQPHRERLGP